MDEIELAKNAFHAAAVKSYIASRLLISTNHLAPIGLYNAHLACECMLKSLIAQTGDLPQFTHNLTSLLSDLRKAMKATKLDDAKLVETLSWLNPYQELGRYGAQARRDFDPNRIDNGTIKAYGIVTYQPSGDIEKIDHAFNLLIALSDRPNMLAEVLNTVTNRQWSFPIPLDEVILTQNDHIGTLSDPSKPQY